MAGRFYENNQNEKPPPGVSPWIAEQEWHEAQEFSVGKDGSLRLRFPRLPDRTLETVYLHLFPEAVLHRQNHRTLDDARMTAKIWLKLME